MMNIQQTGPTSPIVNVLKDYLNQAHLQDDVSLAVEPFDNFSDEAKEAVRSVNQGDNAEKSDMVVFFVFLKEGAAQPAQPVQEDDGNPPTNYDPVEVRNRVRKAVERYLGQNPEYFDADMNGQKVGFVVLKIEDNQSTESP